MKVIVPLFSDKNSKLNIKVAWHLKNCQTILEKYYLP